MKSLFGSLLLTTLLIGCGGGGGGSLPATPQAPGNVDVNPPSDGGTVTFPENGGGGGSTPVVSEPTNTQVANQFTNLVDIGSGFYINGSTGTLFVPVGGNMLLNSSTGSLLIPIGGTMYIDSATGQVVYEETVSTSHDLQKISALKQQQRVQLTALKIHATYGLSNDRSMEVARLAQQLSATPKRSMTDRDYDSFAVALTGSTMNQFRTALRASRDGNTESLNSLIDRAAQVNGVGPEHMSQIMKDVFQ